MADPMEQMEKRLTTMGMGKTIVLGVVVAAAVAAGVVLWMWAQKPELQLLYSNLTPSDSGVIISKLREGRVPFEVSDGGTAILVPRSQVHELRMQLASQGLPQGGGVGFELFDKSPLGTTDFVQRLNVRRALEGELSRTIGQLNKVSKARVHLVTPEKSLFTERQQAPRASVIIELRPGQKLSPEQIQAIVHLVTSSVEGLEANNITVVDNDGRVLTKPVDEKSLGGMTSAQLEYQRDIEGNFEKKIQSMLERVVGPDKAAVRVTAEINLTRTEKTEEKFDPEIQVIRSEQKTTEKSNGSSSSTSPASPGVTANVPPTQGTGQSNSQDTSEKKTETINYEIAKTVSHTTDPVGTIAKLSVAVLVDGKYTSETDAAGKVTKTYAPRADDELKKLEDLVKNAIGFSAERQDQVQVSNLQFEDAGMLDIPADQGTAPAGPSMVQQIFEYVPPKLIIGLILFLLIFFLVLKPLMKTLTAPPMVPVLPPGVAGAGGGQGGRVVGSQAPLLGQRGGRVGRGRPFRVNL